jgi:transcriptional regulator with XRE-family HTH domain
MLGKILKEARIKKGLSQGNIITDLGTGPGYKQFVSNIERGISFPSKKFLKEYCLKTDLNYEKTVFLLIKEYLKREELKMSKKYK